MAEAETKVLDLVKGDISFGVSSPVDPVEFYQNRDGLYVYTHTYTRETEGIEWARGWRSKAAMALRAAAAL